MRRLWYESRVHNRICRMRSRELEEENNDKITCSIYANAALVDDIRLCLCCINLLVNTLTHKVQILKVHRATRVSITHDHLQASRSTQKSHPSNQSHPIPDWRKPVPPASIVRPTSRSVGNSAHYVMAAPGYVKYQFYLVVH